MVTVTKIPSQEEYEKELNRINAKFRKAQEDFNYHRNRALVNNQMSSCSGMHGFTGGMKSCDYWKMQSRKKWENEDKSKYQGAIDSAKREAENYQSSVAKLQTEKKQAELNAELARQQKIIEDNIKETFRIETEKMQALSDALTKERQAKIIPPPPPVIETPMIETPKNEPLAILSDMDRLENYVSRTSEPLEESKINYSTIAIIGAIGIVSILLVRRFA